MATLIAASCSCRCLHRCPRRCLLLTITHSQRVVMQSQWLSVWAVRRGALPLLLTSCPYPSTAGQG